MTHEEEKLSLIIERVESDLRSLKKVMQVKNKIGSDFDIDIESIVEPSEKNDSCMVHTNVLGVKLVGPGLSNNNDIKFYKKKPKVIRAIQYKGDNKKEVMSFLGVSNEHFFCELNEYVVNHGKGSYEIFTEDAFSSLFEVI